MADQKIPAVTVEDASEEQLELMRRGQAGRPFVPKVYATLANHPALMRPWMRFGNALLTAGTLPGDDREILILRAAWNCQGVYEWGQHVGWARKEGLSDEQIEGIGEGPGSDRLDGWQQLLVQAADELFTDASLTDSTWAALAERYDHGQLLETCFVVGQYTMLAYALNSCGVTPEDDAPRLGAAR